jgi:large repetitive protein
MTFLVFNKTVAQKANFETNSGMTIGFGLGAAYEQSDIANSKGGGFDFTLGSYLYKKENAFLSADWKFRFLTGENMAQDHRINTDGTFSNIRYRFFNYDLELGLTLNRLREKTRIVITGFAGAGITHGITKTDQLDESGNPYDYSVIDPNLGREQVLMDLLNLTDGNYETKLIGKAAVMPTAGIYLGYQFSRSFSMGLEHKINFSLTENNSFSGIDIDNNVVSGSRKDRNHYTSLSFRWIIRSGSSGSGSGKSYTVINTYVPVYNPPVPERPVNNPTPVITLPPPLVEIIVPSGNPYSTTEGRLEITARARNVKDKRDIQVVLNNRNIEFDYNPLFGNVRSTITLAEGKNTLIITGSNEAGSNSDVVAIIYNKPVTVVVPMVKFIDPASPVTVNTNILSITVQTRNVKEWQDVTVNVNGINFSNFNFSTEGIVSTNIPLKEGANRVQVTGKNQSGSVSDFATITYTKPVKAIPPAINILNPAASPSSTIEPLQEIKPCPPPVLKMIEPLQNELTTEYPSFTIRTEIRNIVTSEQLSATLNNSPITNYNFNGSEIAYVASLVPGINSYVISATNNCGTQKINYSIFYKPTEVIVEKPCLRPGINFSVTVINREDATHELKGTVSNVKNKSDITFTINDSPFEGFTYLPNTGEISSVFKFNPGSYTIRVAVKNDCGQDTYSGTVVIEEEKPYGIRINPGNSSWEFCMVTPAGTIIRDTLTNSNFRYSGPASSLYFMPIAGGGDAVVKGTPYTIRPGQYYLFTGTMTVTISTNNPGSMGQWSVCIIADREPLSGNGNNRPKSPCEELGDKGKPKL